MASSSSDIKYDRIAGDDNCPSLQSSIGEEDDLIVYAPPKRRLCAGYLNGTLLSILLSLCALVLTIVAATKNLHEFHQDAVPSQRISLGTCGSSSDEARANGCVYDVMMTAWMKPECYDKDLSDYFFNRDSGNWTFYRDTEGSVVLPHEALFRGDYSDYWVQGTYHFSHCSYIWAKQMQQMGKRPVILDSVARNWRHTIHCANMLAKANTTYIGGHTSSHAKLGTSSIDCIIGDWTTFQQIPAELQEGAGPWGE